jgi:hypothetical protein
VDAEKTVEKVGKMIARHSKAMHDDRDARRAFDRYVLAMAAGRQAADLSEGQLRVLQSCDRRVYDRLSKEVSDALGFNGGKTYRDAINLCEKQGTRRAQEEKLERVNDGPTGKRHIDRRQSDGRRGVADLARAIRKRLFHR